MNDVPIFASWSGGKDSCLAFHRALKAGARPICLVTMMIESGERSRSHGLPLRVVEAQAAALGLPLVTRATSWADYETSFRSAIAEARELGAEVGVFGDIDIEDHRAWEENVCKAERVGAHLPLWQEQREALVYEVLREGFRAEIVAVNEALLSSDLLGQALSPDVLEKLRVAKVDLAGENGEYHTVVTDGPLFKRPVRLVHGERVLRSGYWFSDVTEVTP